MENEISISIPFKHLESAVFAVAQATVDRWLEDQPQPDPQYTADQVAQLLNVDVQTVHDYTRLALAHPRRLPFVVTHDSHKGKRFLLSDITAWQRRNRIDELTQEVIPISSKRPARRRATGRAA